MDAATLIDAIVDDPTAIDRWLVYADWLLDRGDPRGELINLELAIEAGTADADAQSLVNRLRRDEERLFTRRFAEQSHYWNMELWRGFVRSATLIGPSDDRPGPEAVAALCADPHAALLEEIALSASDDVIRPLFAVSHRWLRHIATTSVDNARFAASTPALDSLLLARETCAVLELSHPHLRTLTALGDTCPALAQGDFALPALAELACSVAPGSLILENRRSILHRPPPQLAHLSISLELPIENYVLPPCSALVLRIATLPAFRAVSELSIGLVGVELLETLAQNPAPFAHLRRLALEMSAYFDALERDEASELRARLEAAFPGTDVVVPWELLSPPDLEEMPDQEPPIDDQSRRPDGTIDAMGKFTRR